jgi:hypothetical protein
MSKTLLIAAGVVNALFALFHIFLGYKIQFFALPAPVRGLLETFNAGGLLIMVLMAFLFLLRGREVLRTGIGAAFLVFGVALYFGRAVEEFIWMNGNVAIAAGCVAAGLLHLGLLPFVTVPAEPA